MKILGWILMLVGACYYTVISIDGCHMTGGEKMCAFWGDYLCMVLVVMAGWWLCLGRGGKG